MCSDLVARSPGCRRASRACAAGQVCTDGLACKRRVCFFAHHEGELRKVQEEGAPSAGKDVDVLAGARTRPLPCHSCRGRRCVACSAAPGVWRLCWDVCVAVLQTYDNL